MNAIIVGKDKTPTIQHLPDTFLLIDDGDLIESLPLPKRRAVTIFDVAKHHFNPLKDMDYRKAREFIQVLDAVYPEGTNTLTRKNSNFILLQTLLDKPEKLSKLLSPKSKDPAHTDAYQKIQTLLLSPVLRSVLDEPTNVSFKGIILARLNRAELGEFDSFVLANFLISQYRGNVVIPDFGFYACPIHSALLRENRLIAGINSFDEVPTFKQRLLLAQKRIPSHCTAEDAEILAQYAGLIPGINEYNDFVQSAIGG